MIPFARLVVDGLAWLDLHAIGAACFLGPDGLRCTAVLVDAPLAYDHGPVTRFLRFNLIDERVYAKQYLNPQERLF